MHRLLCPIRTAAFTFAVALIVVVFSERIFWYWDTTVEAHLFGAIFYSIAVGAALWMATRHQVTSWKQLVLVAPIFAYVTEGVITPVLYSGGPLPIFPLWFTAWHGLGSLVVLVFGVRAMLLAGRRTALLATSLGFGAFWGLWAATSSLPENLEDPDLLEGHGTLHLLDTAEFAVYAGWVSAVLIAAHVALGWIWPTSFEPGRIFKVVVAALCLVSVATWTAAYFWAMPMFLLLVWLQERALQRRPTPATTPSIFERLAGRIPVRSTWPLLALPAAAIATYDALLAISPSDDALRAIYWGSIAVQTAIATGALIWALRGRRTDDVVNEPTDLDPPRPEDRPFATGSHSPR